MTTNLLTNREKEICLSFINSKGVNSIKFITNDLNISVLTTKTHLYNIYKKLLINSQVELMYFLMKEIINYERNNNKTIESKI